MPIVNDTVLKNVQPFDELVQSSRYHYALSDSSHIRLLNKSENTTYLVEDLKEGHRTVLRINRPGYHSALELQGELLWMQEISDHTGLIIPQPIAGLNGQYIQTLKHEALPHPYHCVMFSFLNGQPPDESNPRSLVTQFGKLGEITAVLHKNARAWKQAREIPRFTWDYDTILGENPRWGKWQNASGITPALQGLCSRASQVIQHRLERFGKGPERFGLIHADLRLANLLVDGDKIAVIDFDDCGFGWYNLDFGSAVSFIEHKSYVPDLLASWLEGYRKIGSISTKDEKEIPTFIMMRRLMLLGWLASHSDSDQPPELDGDYTEKTAEIAEEYLRKFT